MRVIIKRTTDNAENLHFVAGPRFHSEGPYTSCYGAVQQQSARTCWARRLFLVRAARACTCSGEPSGLLNSCGVLENAQEHGQGGEQDWTPSEATRKDGTNVC